MKFQNILHLPVSCILLHVDNLLLRIVECICETFVNYVFVWVFFGKVDMRQILFHLTLNVEGKPVFEKSTHLASVLTVAIAN